jgi:transposase-like protein
MRSTLTAKQQFWSSHLKNVEQSNCSIADYARQNNITPQTLYQWRNTLRKRTQTTISTETLFTQAVVPPDQIQPELIMNVADAQLDFNTLPDPRWLASFLSMATAS